MKAGHVIALAKKDWKKMLREPAFLFMIILFPLVLTLAFGTSFGAVGGSQPTTYNIAVVDLGSSGSSTSSHQFAQALVATGIVKVSYVTTNQTAQSKLSQGQVQGVLLLPASFDASVASFKANPGDPARWTNTTVSLYLDKGSLLSAQVIPSIVGQTLGTAVFGAKNSAPAAPVTILSPSLVSVQAATVFDSFAPGLFAFASIYMIMTVAQSFTTERENGLLSRISTTPATSADLIMGSALSYLVIALVQALLVFACTYGLGYHPATGAVGLALGFLIVTVFALCNIGFGLITAALAKSAGAATGISFLFLLPQLFLGTFVGAALSSGAQAAGRFVPAYYVTDALTSLFTRGAAVTSPVVLTDLAAVSASSVIILLAGTMIFRRFGRV